jgi:hypothetical protein
VGRALDRVIAARGEVRLGVNSPHGPNGQFGAGISTPTAAPATSGKAPAAANSVDQALKNQAAGLSPTGQITPSTLAVYVAPKVQAKSDKAATALLKVQAKAKATAAARKKAPVKKSKIVHHGKRHSGGRGKLPHSSKLVPTKGKASVLHAVKIPNHIAPAKDTGHITH